MTADVEGQIAASLRSLLDTNSLSNVKIIGYEVGLFPLVYINNLPESRA